MTDALLYQLTGFDLYVDWNRNQAYDHADSNISAYVYSITYRYGFDTPFKEVAPPARMQVLLDNSSGDWSVGKTGAKFASVFRKGVLVRLRYIYNTVDHDNAFIDPIIISSGEVGTRFIGMITQIQLSPGSSLGEKTALLTIEDPMLNLLDTEYHPPLQTNVTTSAALTQLFDDAIAPYPYPQSYWMLEIAGASELETTTILFQNTITNFDTGQSTLPYVGDNSDEGHGITAQSYIRDMVAAEAGGKFYWDAPNAKFRFLNRYYATTFDEFDYINFGLGTETGLLLDGSPPQHHFADDLVNQVEVSYELKAVGSSTVALYIAPNVPFSIAAGQTRRFTARYQDPDAPTARVGGINMIYPVPSVDYSANSASDGSGSNLTSSLIATAEFRANSALVSLTNPTASVMYITSFQLRGKALTAHAKETAYALNGDSIFNYGRQQKALFLPTVQSADFAQDYANTQINRFSLPMNRYERITVNMNALDIGVHNVLSLEGPNFKTVGNALLYLDPFLQDASDDLYYMIVGEEGQISNGNIWDVTWVLEPIPRVTYWALGIVGSSELGVSTVLAL